MNLKRSLRRFAKSSAAFTAVLVAITLGVFGIVISQLPKGTTSTPAPTAASFAEVSLAEELWPVILQGEKLALIAKTFPGEPKLNAEGEAWSTALADYKKSLKVWLARQGVQVNQPGQSVQSAFTLPPEVMSNLDTASASFVSHAMVTLLGNTQRGLVVAAKDPILVKVVKGLSDLKDASSANLKDLLSRP
ncbi:MAG: hypothetical protein RLZ71_318 [Actinomycetota bacterium]